MSTPTSIDDRPAPDSEGRADAVPAAEPCSRRRRAFETLDREMELADYATNERGQRRKKMPRKQSLYRTKKRKVLEKEDARERAIRAEERRPRLRGAKVAFEDEVVKGSMIFGGQEPVDSTEDRSSVDGEEEEWVPDNDEGSGDGSVEDCQNDDDDDDEEVEEGATNADHSSKKTGMAACQANGHATLPNRNESVRARPTSRHEEVARAKEAVKSGKSNISRVMYRLRNFKSHKLVERQGDALGAHARGMHRTAIQKLGEVASAAPLAPQVYSSLGLVYENMLREQGTPGDDGCESRRTSQDDGSADDNDDGAGEDDDENQSMASRIAIAKKAYGSYHIAAVMCKKDFTLWVRAADAAMEIADTYNLLMTMPKTPTQEIEKHRAEKKRWLEEAKNDYQAADNLQPPGITVPAKLASVQMDLGNLSEALTILTDLKNKGQGDSGGESSASSKNARQGRSELERSYSAWLLYADLMLRIGHECNKWNQGIETNENYMFRRWLRKYSLTFDWKERRLQALCFALEAAAGSEACDRLIEWTRERAEKTGRGGSRDKRGATDSGRWYVDTYEMDKASPNEEENAEEKSEKAAGADDGSEYKDSGVEEPETGHASASETAAVNNTAQSIEEIPTENGASNEGSYSLSLSAIKARFERDRELLLTKNKSELAAFDATSTEMNLVPDSDAAKERETLRATLVKNQRSTVVALVGEYHQNQARAASRNKIVGEGREKNSSVPPLPMSASCASVCNLAALLMRQCMDLELFHGSSLIGEAVSLYLRERADRHERRMDDLNNNQRCQGLRNHTFQMHASYDDINDDSDVSDSDDTHVEFISDDDELEIGDKSEMLRSMQSGALPSELQVLYALSLIGEGGKNYAARKALSAISDLDEEDSTKVAIDTDITPDSSWCSFRRSMAEPLNKTAAFSLAADLFEKTEEDRKNDWIQFAQLFRTHVDYLEQNRLLKVATATNEISETSLIRKSQYLKILQASLKMQLMKAMELASSSDAASHGTAPDVAMLLIENLIHFEHVLWNGVSPDGSLSHSEVETLKILSGAFSIFVEGSPNLRNQVGTKSPIFAKLRHVVSLVFQVNVPLSDGDSHACVPSWHHFPLPSDWQRTQERTLSLRVFNLCVGYAVPTFSGWKSNFSLRALMNSSGPNFFGIHVNGEQISGIVSREIELELTSQWKQVNKILPRMPCLDFERELTKAKGTSWHAETKERLDRQGGNVALSSCGEGNGIMILLRLSKLCLCLVKGSKEGDGEGCLRASMSILLPLSQFCLDRKLWSSDIGSNAATQEERMEWSYFVATSSAFQGAASDPLPRQPRKQRRAASRPQPTPRIQPRIQSKLTARNRKECLSQVMPLLSKVAKVSSAQLLREWTKDISEDDCSRASSQSPEQARLAMKRVDHTITQLRTCSTVHALQKASIKAASALLEVADRPECYNPFVCLQQAVMFAGHGAKLGNNDDPFKKALPLENDCSAVEAMMILGRSDCLRALHFTDEAMFLCSFVSRVCRLHRERSITELRWTPRWRCIRIYAYMVSVAIDSTISSLLDGHAKDAALAAWEKDVKEEIARGRSDAMSVCEGEEGLVDHDPEPLDEEDESSADDVEMIPV